MTATTLIAKSGRSRRNVFGRNSPLFVGGLVWLGAIVLLGITGSLWYPHNATSIDLLNPYANPSAQHWLGTDSSGRDIFSRLIQGTIPTLLGPLLVVGFSVTLGGILAVLASWFGGAWEALISRTFDILFAFPGILIAILASAIFGAGFWAPVIALSVAYSPVLGRILKTSLDRELTLPYLSALRVQGFSSFAIIARHLVPSQLPIVAVQCAVVFSYALLDLAAISYLGLGVQEPATDWGLLVSTGQSAILAGYPNQSIFAAVAILVTVLALNICGDRLARRFEIGER